MSGDSKNDQLLQAETRTDMDGKRHGTTPKTRRQAGQPPQGGRGCWFQTKQKKKKERPIYLVIEYGRGRFLSPDSSSLSTAQTEATGASNSSHPWMDPQTKLIQQTSTTTTTADTRTARLPPPAREATLNPDGRLVSNPPPHVLLRLRLQ